MKRKDIFLLGTFEYPFEFLLPENIPTSIKNPTCTIEYKVVATFLKENFYEIKKSIEAEVTVYGYVNPCSPEPQVFSIQKDFFAPGVTKLHADTFSSQ